MKCPKCGYLGFESSDRCRNCGYDFSLAADRPPALEITLELEDEPTGPLPDLQLVDRGESEARKPLEGLDLDRLIGVPVPTTDLPLFSDRPLSDAPLITPAPIPRAPLAVRRATPEVPRLRSRSPRAEAPELEFDSVAPISQTAPGPRLVRSVVVPPRPAERPARSFRRLAAGMLDAALLLGIDATVIYFTLRLSGLTTTEVGILPKVPLGMFVLLLNGGYLAAFSAVGGQTIGKMAFGLKVVADGNRPLDVGQAIGRAAGSMLSLLPLGLGFVPAFFGEDHRAIHDRLAGTRVIQLTKP